ncbi:MULTISPECIES: hypothetical protein [unclassified Streptomyces]|uniref:hypothetical protein n=1 Tax=unclassified Streptomyces TaxID=2593676 RepID=UPI00336A4AA5
MVTVISEQRLMRVLAATNPKNVREEETPEGSRPRPTLKELEQRAEALAKAIRKHLERGRRR